MRMLMIVAATGIALASAAQAQCRYEPWMTYKGDRLDRLPDESAYLYQTDRMAIDADGAPNAYHPDNIGLDDTRNAGWPDTSWWPGVLVRDPENPSAPYRQPSGAFAGYFVSKTRLEDATRPETDPARYVDARTVPYIVFPGQFYKLKGTGLFGDLGLAVHRDSGLMSAFIVADLGPSGHSLGEVSIALAEALGGENVNPRTGAGMPGGEVLYIVFPYSARQREVRWPLSVEEIDRRAMTLLETAGGVDAALPCR